MSAIIEQMKAGAGERKIQVRILHADDDAGERLACAAGLTHGGYQVSTVHDGVEARQALQKEHFDVLITDNEMPGMSGLELIARLRLAGNRLPIILASGTVNHLGRHYDWLDFQRLQKPFSSEQLRAAVERVLGRHVSLQREVEPENREGRLEWMEKLPDREWGLNE